jgi:hypothetical protein
MLLCQGNQLHKFGTTLNPWHIQASQVIEIPLDDQAAQSTVAGKSLQDAFKDRPVTAKKRPNKKRQELRVRRAFLERVDFGALQSIACVQVQP